MHIHWHKYKYTLADFHLYDANVLECRCGHEKINGSIKMEIKVDTKKFHKDIKKLMGWRMRLADFLVILAEKIVGKGIKIDYEIRQVK